MRSPRIFDLEMADKSLKKAFYIILCFLLTPVLIHAQSQDEEFSFINIKEGIPKTGIYTIIQDHNGLPLEGAVYGEIVLTSIGITVAVARGFGLLGGAHVGAA